MAVRRTAALSTAGQRRQDRGQSWAAGTLYARSMGGHGTRYPQQGRGPGTSTAASNYAKLAPARGAWSCLPPPLLLAASSCCSLSCEPAFLLLFSPVHTPSTPAVHPPCFPLVVSPASTESASCGLERHGHTHDENHSRAFALPAVPLAFTLLSPWASTPATPATACVNFRCSASSTSSNSHPQPPVCLLTHPDPEIVARRQPQ